MSLLWLLHGVWPFTAIVVQTRRVLFWPRSFVGWWWGEGGVGARMWLVAESLGGWALLHLRTCTQRRVDLLWAVVVREKSGVTPLLSAPSLPSPSLLPDPLGSASFPPLPSPALPPPPPLPAKALSSSLLSLPAANPIVAIVIIPKRPAGLCMVWSLPKPLEALSRWTSMSSLPLMVNPTSIGPKHRPDRPFPRLQLAAPPSHRPLPSSAPTAVALLLLFLTPTLTTLPTTLGRFLTLMSSGVIPTTIVIANKSDRAVLPGSPPNNNHRHRRSSTKPSLTRPSTPPPQTIIHKTINPHQHLHRIIHKPSTPSPPCHLQLHHLHLHHLHLIKNFPTQTID